ncbi:MAG TPA: hypothetical protein VHC69_06490 [Polyangiaceae bacterium]|nr:hypothetical protein [Polyangiaceae bacterium]
MSIWGSAFLVVISACSGAGKTSSGNTEPNGGNASRDSGASVSTPSDSGSYAPGSGGRTSGSGGASTGAARSTSSGGATSAGGITSTGDTTGSGGHSGAGGDTSECSAELQTVSNDFQMAVSDADLSCTNDAECVEGPTPACDFYCSAPVVSKKGAGRLLASVDETAAACTRVQMQGCSSGPIPCVLSLGSPACVNGTCKRFIPVAWSSVSFAEAPSADVTCDGAGACEEWTVYPDGRVTDTPPDAAPRTAMLLPSDIERVTAIVESVAFRQGFYMAFPCTAAASPHAPITLARQDPTGNHYDQLVQDCIYGGPAGNDVLTLWNVAHDAFAADAGQ